DCSKRRRREMVWDRSPQMSYHVPRSARMHEAEQQPMLHIDDPDDVNRNTIEFYNQRSRIVHADAEEKMIFLFDYRGKEKDEECIHWKHLKELKDRNKWGVLRHPMVLNFINERLIECAFFYFLHLAAFFTFLLLLSSHIFSNDIFQDILVTLFVLFFMFFMLLKGAIKARISNSISLWFIVAYSFNILTFVATLAYVWLPHLFEYDDFHQDVKKIILWFLPIVAVMSAWINFLYILRKSPYGIYIFMMVRILKSFGRIATIWIPTLIAFSFAFHLILRDSDVEPWKSSDPHNNATTIDKLFTILQAVTKTSTMMIGEVDADNILGTKMWIPSMLVLIFEIITVILLMNLMVSLAVGDVEYLRNTSQDKILRIKLNFVIEALQLAEALDIPILSSIHTNPTNNMLVVSYEGSHFAKMDPSFNRVFDGCLLSQSIPSPYPQHIQFGRSRCQKRRSSEKYQRLRTNI
ncbi:trpa-2, partial [Pristionchus pacificus]